MSTEKQIPPFLKSTYPVSFPSHPALFFTPADFESFLKHDLDRYRRPNLLFVDDPTLPIREAVPANVVNVEEKALAGTAAADTNSPSWANIAKGNMADEAPSKPVDDDHPFMKALLNHDPNPSLRQNELPENTMRTENADLAYRSSNSALVDLFFELEEVVAADRLVELLHAAWNEDALMTLKIIFNARSIHLGKSSRRVFYRCIDWLSMHHPLTCLFSLQWLPRPVIEKKVEKKDNEDDIEFIEPEKGEDDPSRHDVRNGVAHGYYKDLLNILALAANRKLDDPRVVLNVEKKTHEVVWIEDEAMKIRHELRDTRHENAVKIFTHDAFYRGLHLMVARIFAEQLRSDLKLLRSGDKKALRRISLCAKWAPSSKLFHDKHTFIVSSIAELLHSQNEFEGVTDREQYLRHAREAYRKDVSTLRKELGIVERDISATNFQNIKYDHVPSLAMSLHSGLFFKKDEERFTHYMDEVATGKKAISGATLLPSTLVHLVRSNTGSSMGNFGNRPSRRVRGGRPAGSRLNTKAMIAAKEADMQQKVADSQWKTLVKRIKDSGILENSIAVCDVSGSMYGPTFDDGTTPVDSSIGLSLLLSEVVEPPFGGAIITFSSKPSVVTIDSELSFQAKVRAIEGSNSGFSTDFVAVFEDLILPMAVKHRLKQEDMVKRVFVFSDMQFDEASHGGKSLSTSYSRVQDEYARHGYEMPQLIFWNLAGGRAGYNGGGGDTTAPKPVTAGEHNTALVSGYSQGLLKVFLANGAFDEADEELEDEIVEKTEATEDGDEITLVETVKKQKMDPLSTVKRAISHKAYSMLKVVD